MVCPYYNNGYCVSPRLGKPNSTVTSSLRCIKNYTSCSYYVQRNEQDRRGLLNYVPVESERLSFYPQINIIDEDMISECEYFRPIRTDKGIVVRCIVLNRLLTTHQALLCVKEYKGCPFRTTAK